MSIEKEIWKTIAKSRRILITSHERIDGDGVGSELALLHMAAATGRETVIINDGEAPQMFAFLPGIEKVRVMPDGWRDDFDLAVALDSATAERLRSVRERIPASLKIINIDHHLSNSNFGAVNWIGNSVSSTGEMLFGLARENGIKITPEIATCLYTAIITDTGRFCFSNTLPSTHLVAAELVRCGASPSEISRYIYREERCNVIQLKRLATATLGFSADGAIAWMDVTADMHRQTDTGYLDTQDFVDIPKSVKGVEVALLFREIAEDGVTRISMRSEGHVDVNVVAEKFGGGGHPRAAGCSINAPIAEARKAILPVIEKMLSEYKKDEGRKK
jgi:phosphoesterase RecJ-like protein